MDDATIPRQISVAQARPGDNGFVSALLSRRYSPIETACTLVAALSSCSGQLSVTELESLSFLRDMNIRTGGSVSCTVIRSLARAELKRRGAWRKRDRLHAILFGCWYSDAESRTI